MDERDKVLEEFRALLSIHQKRAKNPPPWSTEDALSHREARHGVIRDVESALKYGAQRGTMVAGATGHPGIVGVTRHDSQGSRSVVIDGNQIVYEAHASRPFFFLRDNHLHWSKI